MNKLIWLLLLPFCAHAQVNIQGTNVQIGGSAGGTITGTVLTSPPGDQNVTNPSGTTTGLNSINNVLWVDGFTGADFCVKFNAALASVAGSSGSPTPSVTLTASPRAKYAVTNQCVVPNDTTFPYIHQVIVKGNGAAFTWNGASGTPPFLLLGSNDTRALGTGWIEGFSLITTTVAVPALISNSGRPAFGIINNGFNGNSGMATACYSLTNTTATGGVGYDEQSFVSLNGFDNCPDGIGLHIGSGGTNSMDYSWFIQNHFQLQNANVGFHVHGDEGFGGFSLQGVHFSSNTNTAGGTGPAATIKVDSGSTMLSTIFEGMAGEDTGGNGFYDILGFMSGDGAVNTRASLGIAPSNPIVYTTNNNTAVSNTSQTVYGKNGTPIVQSILHENEGPPLGRANLLSKIQQTGGQFWKMYGANEGTAAEQVGNTQFKLMKCPTVTGNPDVFDPTLNCVPGLYWAPNGYGGPGGVVYSGTGWGEEGGTIATSPQPFLPLGTFMPTGEINWVGHSFVAASQTTNSSTQANAVQEVGFNCGSDGTCAEFTYANTPLKLVSEIPSGSATTGTALTGTTSIGGGGSISTVNGRLSDVVPVTVPAAVTLQTNGTNNGSQSTLNLVAGTNVTLSNSGGSVTISASGGGGGGSIVTTSTSISVGSGGGTYSGSAAVAGASSTSACIVQVTAPGIPFSGSSSGNALQSATGVIDGSGNCNFSLVLTPPSGTSFTAGSYAVTIKGLL